MPTLVWNGWMNEQLAGWLDQRMNYWTERLKIA